MKAKHIIGGMLISLGALVIFGAVGHLDYMDECGERYGSGEIREMAVRSVGGLVAVGIGAFLCRDIEVDESEVNEDENTDSV